MKRKCIFKTKLVLLPIEWNCGFYFSVGKSAKRMKIRISQNGLTKMYRVNYQIDLTFEWMKFGYTNISILFMLDFNSTLSIYVVDEQINQNRSLRRWCLELDECSYGPSIVEFLAVGMAKPKIGFYSYLHIFITFNQSIFFQRFFCFILFGIQFCSIYMRCEMGNFCKMRIFSLIYKDSTYSIVFWATSSSLCPPMCRHHSVNSIRSIVDQNVQLNKHF